MVFINLESIIVMKDIIVIGDNIVIKDNIVIRESKVRVLQGGTPMWAWDPGFNISR